MKLINIHSLVDIITNSSTVIYTYQDGSVEPAKELLKELLTMMDIPGEVEDLFYVGVFADEDAYFNYFENTEDDGEEVPSEFQAILDMDDYKQRYKALADLIEKVLIGEMEKPDWMNEAESYEGYSYYTPDTTLHIRSKDDKYKPFIEKMLTFLGSTDHEACQDG